MTDGCAHEATHQAGDIILFLRMVLIWGVKENIALVDVLPDHMFESVHTQADLPKCLDSTCFLSLESVDTHILEAPPPHLNVTSH